MASTISVKLQLIDQMSDRLKRVEANTEKALGGMKKSSEGLKSSFVSLAKSLGGLIAAGQVISFMKESIKLANIQQQAETKLSTALGKTSKALLDQASALQEVTLFGDEQTIAAQAALATYQLEEAQIKSLIPVIQDMAQAKGMDLVQAADLVGKSIGSSTNALSRYGIVIEGVAGSNERTASAVSSLSKMFEGQAEAAGKTGAAAIIKYNNAVGDVKEEIGKELIPQLKTFTKFFIENKKTIAGFAVGSMRIVQGIGQTVIAAVSAVAEGISNIGKLLVGGIVKLVSIGTDKLGTFYGFLAKQAEKLPDFLGGSIKQSLEDASKAMDVFSIKAGGKAEQLFMGANFDVTKAAFETAVESYISGVNKIMGKKKEMSEQDTAVTGKIIENNAKQLEDENKKVKQLDFLGRRELTNAEKVTQAKLGLADQMIGAFGDLAKAAGASAQAQKAIAIGQTIINTSAAIMKVLAQGGLLAIPASIAIGAQGAAQIATIAAQKFATGGIVGGNSTSGDRVPAMVNSGEMILNRQQQNNLFNQINSGGGGGAITINAPVTVNGGDASSIEDGWTRQLEKIKNAVRELQFSGELAIA